MPKRSDIKSILIIGAGPIIIGQACEFDYSGAQACKALREEGYKVILVNSNPATIMTDPEMADVTYIEPITWQVVERIIAKERPDAILPTMGGQTALNCALDLYRNGVFEYTHRLSKPVFRNGCIFCMARLKGFKPLRKRPLQGTPVPQAQRTAKPLLHRRGGPFAPTSNAVMRKRTPFINTDFER